MLTEPVVALGIIVDIVTEGILIDNILLESVDTEDDHGLL